MDNRVWWRERPLRNRVLALLAEFTIRRADTHRVLTDAEKAAYLRRGVPAERITVLPTPGHTPFHQSVLISDGADVVFFAGDLFPTAAHTPLPWIMAYDLEPMVTLATKREVLARAESERWAVVFEHDPDVVFGRVVRDSKSYSCLPLDTPFGRA